MKYLIEISDSDYECSWTDYLAIEAASKDEAEYKLLEALKHIIGKENAPENQYIQFEHYKVEHTYFGYYDNKGKFEYISPNIYTLDEFYDKCFSTNWGPWVPPQNNENKSMDTH